jgi:zinc protease
MVAFICMKNQEMPMKRTNRRLVIFTSLAAILFSSLAVAQQPLVPPTAQRRLLNDLQMIVASTPHLGDDMTIGLVLRYGSSFDPAGKNGLAYLLSQLFGKATIDKTARDIQAELDYLEASLEIRADWDGIYFFLRGRSEKYERSLLVLYQIVAEALFEEAAFTEVKVTRLAQLQREEDPRQRIRTQFEMELFRGTTYGRSLRGTPETIQEIGVGDIRLFYRRFFSPAQAALVVAGSVPTQSVIQKATRIWGIWVRKDAVPFTFLPPRDPASRRIFLEDDPNSPAAQFIMGNLWTRREEMRFYAANLAARILQKRLTKALPTSLLTVAAVGRRLDGPFYVQGQAAADQASGEIRSIIEVVDSIKTGGVREEELTKAQQDWLQQFGESLETTQGICQYLLNAELYRLGTNFLSNFAEVVNRVGVDDVRDAAKANIFPGETLGTVEVISR